MPDLGWPAPGRRSRSRLWSGIRHWHGVRLFRRQGTFWAGHAQRKGDTVTFTLSLTAPLHTPCLCVRYWNPADESSEYDVNGQVTLQLPPCQKPSIAILPLNASIPAGKFTLTLTAAGVGGAKLDCLALCEQADAGNFTVTLRGDGSRPQAEPAADENYLTLQYPHIQECYGILWDDITTHIRTIETTNWISFCATPYTTM